MLNQRYVVLLQTYGDLTTEVGMEEVSSYAEGLGLDKGAYFLNISGGKTMHLLTTFTPRNLYAFLFHISATNMPFGSTSLLSICLLLPHPCCLSAFCSPSLLSICLLVVSCRHTVATHKCLGSPDHLCDGFFSVTSKLASRVG